VSVLRVCLWVCVGFFVTVHTNTYKNTRAHKDVNCLCVCVCVRLFVFVSECISHPGMNNTEESDHIDNTLF